MQLTKHTDFAFRILLYLAAQPEGKLVNIQDVCEFYDISQSHISKIVMKLAKSGYISAFRGKGGGICLAVDPSTVNVAKIVEEFEPSLRLVNCTEPHCALDPVCKLKRVLRIAMGKLLEELRGYTLQDLLDDKTVQVLLLDEGVTA